MKRLCDAPSGSSGAGAALDKQARQDLRAELVASSHGPKSSVARVLQKLQAHGLLNDPELGCKDEQRRLTEASHAHANARTPYGTVVQAIPLQMDDDSVYAWEVIHPLAFMWYLAKVCMAFSKVFGQALRDAAGVLSILLYGDDLTPGNPLRHDHGRKVFTFYYSFLQLPAWLLHRQEGWFCFASLRVDVIDNVRGGVSAVFAEILKLMFTAKPANLSDGSFIFSAGVEVMMKATFKGIIADEKGLKEAWDIMGKQEQNHV